MSDDDTSRLRQAASESPSVRRGGGPSGLLAWLPWIAAAVFAALTGLLVQIHYARQAELVTLREQMALAGIELRSLQQRVEAEHILSARRVADLVSEQHAQARPGVEVVPLVPRADGTPSCMAVAVWSPGLQEGELVVFRLPDPGPDRSFQLWITDPKDPVPVSAGAFTVDPAATNTRVHFKTDRPVPAGAAFAISIERTGGAKGIEGPIVLSSQ
jgi:Anti-sigma-K factor rskA